MSQEPATIYSGIHTELQGIFNSKRDITELEILRIKKQISDLMRVDSKNAYELYGMLGAVSRDYNSMVDNHEKALKLAQYDQNANSNYAVFLSYFGCFGKAYEIAKRVNARDPGNIKVLYDVIDYAIKSGKFKEASDHFVKLQKLTDETFKDFEYQINSVRSYIEDQDLAENDIINMLNIVETIVTDDIKVESNYLFRGLEVNIQEDDDSSWVSFKYYISASINKVVDLNFKIADALAESGLSKCTLNNFTIQFAPGDV